MNRPNILLITTDSQRCDTLGCMGSEFAYSPHLDKLAKEGVMFEQAHTSSPVCAVARSSLITGLHSPVHGCIENGLNRYNHFPTLTDHLKDAGYHNIMVGKTHFGPVPESFDVKHVVTEKMINANDCYAEHIRRHGYSRVSDHPNSIPEELFMESFLVDKTIEEITNCTENGDAPFFAFCSMVSPHEPIDPPGKWATFYDEVDLPEINYSEGEIADFPEQMKKLLGFTDYAADQPPKTDVKLQNLFEARGAIYHEEIRDEVNKLRKLYYGLSSYCDDQIGRLIQFINDANLREDTLIIFSTDHGLQLFDHGFNDKHNYYDASWRVPFIMSMPGTLPQGETRQFASWNDIPTSILGAAGLQSDSMQGFDLFTALEKGEPSPRKCAVGTLFKSAALATENWKLEYYFDESEPRLFDRKYDPLERKNIYHNPELSDIRDELVKALLTWRADIMDLHMYHEAAKAFTKQIEPRKKIEQKKPPHKRRQLAPVATRVTSAVSAIKGSDSEERLNQHALKIDSLYNRDKVMKEGKI
ncbi:sulfatase-like hydrolase/transferase [Gracilibacillus sp. YIM 98692]|uniref:sulfatase family protein n=1 Tax=Gracilibacillus sp. YIM 98692 TaxID=2663532 RepID=UPI0013CFBC3E|nr:sulfatase-like hydrolase/transferase [Gracilibacillus sp. YIM 98692]